MNLQNYDVFAISRLNHERRHLTSILTPAIVRGGELLTHLSHIPGLYHLQPGLDAVTFEADRVILVRDHSNGRALVELCPARRK